MYRVTPPRTNHPEHIDNVMLTSCAHYYPDLNIIYINTAKNASTTLLSWCGGNEHIPIQYYSYLGVHSLYGVQNEEKVINLIPKLFIIRNPIDRVVSSFFEVMKLVRADKFIGTLTPEEEDKFLDWANKKYNLIDSFNMFLKSISDNNFYDRHTFPQVVSLNDSGFPIDEVSALLFENLGEELDAFCKKYNILNPRKFLITNKTMSPLKKELEMYVNSNIDIQNKIKEIYKEDWDLYSKIKNSRS
jgi:hypothetical protein